jgi:hypothetical protein
MEAAIRIAAMKGMTWGNLGVSLENVMEGTPMGMS